MKRFFALILVLTFLLIFVSCGENSDKEAKDGTSIESESTIEEETSSIITQKDVSQLENYEACKLWLDEMLEKYWVGDQKTGHFVHIHAGYVIEREKPYCFWEIGVMLMAMENYYLATHEERVVDYISSEWAYLQQVFTKQELTANFGQTPNLASDDTAWSVQTFMCIYRVTGDETALDYAHLTINGAYDYFQDEDMKFGMWYCDTKQYSGDQWKSAYSIAYILCVLEYCEITKGTDKYDAEMLSRTMDLYQWTEEHLRRQPCTIKNGLQDGSSYTITVDDGLYWCDYNENRTTRTEKNGPDGGTRPNDIHFYGSVSFLYANVGMASVNCKLYEQTENQTYLDKAIKTMNSLTEVYASIDGTYYNDRDVYDGCCAFRYYVLWALTKDGAPDSQKQMLKTTTDVILTYGRQSACVYSYDWMVNASHFTDHFCINANTLCLATAGLYADSLHLFDDLE